MNFKQIQSTEKLGYQCFRSNKIMPIVPEPSSKGGYAQHPMEKTNSLPVITGSISSRRQTSVSQGKESEERPWGRGGGSLLPRIFWMVWSVPAPPDTSENESVQVETVKQDQGPPEPPPQWRHFTINPFGQRSHMNSVSATESNYEQDCYSFSSTENHSELKRQTQDTWQKIHRQCILLMNPV